MRYNIGFLLVFLSFEARSAGYIQSLMHQAASAQGQLTAVRADHATTQQALVAVRADHAVAQQRATVLAADLRTAEDARAAEAGLRAVAETARLEAESLLAPIVAALEGTRTALTAAQAAHEAEVADARDAVSFVSPVVGGGLGAHFRKAMARVPADAVLGAENQRLRDENQALQALQSEVTAKEIYSTAKKQAFGRAQEERDLAVRQAREQAAEIAALRAQLAVSATNAAQVEAAERLAAAKQVEVEAAERFAATKEAEAEAAKQMAMAAQAETNAAEAALAEASLRSAAKRREVSEVTHDLSSARRHQNSAQARAAAAEQRAEQLAPQYRENELAMQQSHASQMGALKAQCAAVTEALESLEANCAAQGREIAAKQQECQDLQAQFKDLQLSLDAATQKDSAQLAKIMGLNDHKQALEAKIRQLQDKAAADTGELERLRGVNKRYLEAQRQLADLQMANTTLRAASQAAAGEVTALNLQLQKTQRAHSENLEALRAEHGKVVAHLHAEKVSKEQEITEGFDSKMGTLVAEQKAALAVACAAKDFNAVKIADLQNRYDQNVAALNAEKQGALSVQAAASKAVLSDAEARHAQALQNLTAQLDAQAARITALMDSEKSLKALSAQANETKDALAGQLAALKGQFEAQVAANAENKDALATLNLRHAITKRILSKRGNQVQELADAIAQLKSSLLTTTVQKDSLDGQVAALTAALAEQTRVSHTQVDQIARQVEALAGKDAEITALQAQAQQSVEHLLAVQKEFEAQEQLHAEKHAAALKGLRDSQAAELDGLTISHRAAQASLTAQIAEAKDDRASLEARYREQQQAYESAQTALKAKHGEAIKYLEVQHTSLIENLTARLASQGQEHKEHVAALEERFAAKEVALQEELAATKASASASAEAQAAEHAAALEVLREEHAVVLDQLRVENVRLASELSAVKAQLETAFATAGADRRVHGDAIASARATHAQLQQAVTEAQEALKRQSVAHGVARKLAFDQASQAADQSRSQQATIRELQEKLQAFQAALASVSATIDDMASSDGHDFGAASAAAGAMEDKPLLDSIEVFEKVKSYYSQVIGKLEEQLHAYEERDAPAFEDLPDSRLQSEFDALMAVPLHCVSLVSAPPAPDQENAAGRSGQGDLGVELAALMATSIQGGASWDSRPSLPSDQDTSSQTAVGTSLGGFAADFAALMAAPIVGGNLRVVPTPLARKSINMSGAPVEGKPAESGVKSVSPNEDLPPRG
jgi:hypothetical protein